MDDLKEVLSKRAEQAACLVFLEDLRLTLTKKLEALKEERETGASTLAGCTLALKKMTKLINKTDDEVTSTERDQAFLAEHVADMN